MTDPQPSAHRIAGLAAAALVFGAVIAVVAATLPTHRREPGPSKQIAIVGTPE